MSASDVSSLATSHDFRPVDKELSGNTSPTSSGNSRDEEDNLFNGPQSDTTVSDNLFEEGIPQITFDEVKHMREKLQEIFEENILAKMMRVATEGLENNVSWHRTS